MKITAYLTLLSLVAYVASQQFTKSFEIDGLKYYLSDPVKKNWYQAQRFCYEQGTALLDLETPEDNTKVLTYLREHTSEIPLRSYWIGGTSLGSEGEFYWVTTGSRIKYSGFSANQPDSKDNNEFCLELREEDDLDWNDADCDYFHYFICRQTKHINLESKVPVEIQNTKQNINTDTTNKTHIRLKIQINYSDGKLLTQNNKIRRNIIRIK